MRASRTSPTTIYFNPRSHEGSDAGTADRLFHGKIFQSTLPRGERLAPLDEVRHDLGISIHAPTRGATQ